MGKTKSQAIFDKTTKVEYYDPPIKGELDLSALSAATFGESHPREELEIIQSPTTDAAYLVWRQPMDFEPPKEHFFRLQPSRFMLGMTWATSKRRAYNRAYYFKHNEDYMNLYGVSVYGKKLLDATQKELDEKKLLTTNEGKEI
jgi:hypothetical protein